MKTSVSIVVPTFNEEENIRTLIQLINRYSRGYEVDYSYEIIVVDDGMDKTLEYAVEHGAVGIKGQRKGLGQAIIDGIYHSNKDIVLVMDSDLQHNPRDIPRLLEPIVKMGVDFTIGSKYVKGGDTSEWSLFRRLVSTISGYFWYPFLGIKDANSGYFCFRKSILDGVTLKGDSWKVMLEVLVKGNWICKQEVPIKFGDREYGESKNSIKQAVILTFHMVKLIFTKYRFLRFGLVGATFAGVHFGSLYVLTEFAHIHYLVSAVVSGVITATLAYAVNHKWTFERIKIRHGWLAGWLEYVAVCALGELTYLGMLALFTEVANIWYFVSAMIAICINYPIKYMVVSHLVWQAKERGNSESADFEWRGYWKGNVLRRKWKHAIINDIAITLGNRATGRVLDYGCGSAPTAVYISHSDYVGIDINRNKINYMNAKSLPECNYICGDHEALLKYDSKSFDVVLCVEVVEHLDDRLMIIHWLERLIKSKGLLVIATPEAKSILWGIIEQAQKILQPDYHTSKHTYLFTSDNIINKCKELRLKHLKTTSLAFGMDKIYYFRKK